ncbi:uncharacterized protein LOC111702886 [Eurytemora carolleeae]|uniref:uncharacterized protein LOC111702886 n=1 Tax=Eurytemora carolleeae TaxID=1294199 RepID=UPI000C75F3B0|nr:uncharacterized protein LOC111702886 [Eurytemora carolleeae]|eukprot:XP_023330449.1 uncharacterized protein LOC111702886 [Eurytemora affinis]
MEDAQEQQSDLGSAKSISASSINQSIITVSTMLLNLVKFASCADKSEIKGQRQAVMMLGLLVLPMFPILTLIVQNAHTLSSLVNLKTDMLLTELVVKEGDEIAACISRLQEERSMVAYYLSADRNKTQKDILRNGLQEKFAETDRAIVDISNWEQDKEGRTTFDQQFSSKIKFQIRLEDFRTLVLKSGNSSVDSAEGKTVSKRSITTVLEVMDKYNAANYVLLNQLSSKVSNVPAKQIWKFLVSYENLVRATEHIGIETVQGVSFYSRGDLSDIGVKLFIQSHKLAEDYLEQTKIFVPEMVEYLSVAQSQEDFLVYSALKDDYFQAVNGSLNFGLLITGDNYYKSATSYTRKIQAIIERVRGLINKSVQDELYAADKQQEHYLQLSNLSYSFLNFECIFAQAIGILSLVVVLVISPFIILLSRNAIQSVQIFNRSVKKKSDELRAERKRTDKLLYKMLPSIVADGLRSGKSTTETFQSATVAFIKIDGFSDFSKETKIKLLTKIKLKILEQISVLFQFHSPLDVMNILNLIYSKFDSRVDMFNVYKVETINDSYMVASGLPEKNDIHASEISALCLDISRTCENMKIPRSELVIRISAGIHTGGVVAGIVGSKMPRYCLFGDTVNTASRMQSSGEVGRIQITSETKSFLDMQGDDFKYTLRGTIDVKGKGMMETYWLLSQTLKPEIQGKK